MPTMAEYASSGGYARDAQTARNVASMPSYSSGSSSSRSSSGNSSQKTPVPYNPTQEPGYFFPGSSTQTGGGIPAPAGSGGYMNVPIAGGGGTPPMPSSYKVGDVTYTPGPANWGSMSQSQRDAYGRGISGGNVSSPTPAPIGAGGLYGRGTGGAIGLGGGTENGVYYPPLAANYAPPPGIWTGPTPQSNKNYAVTADMGMGGKTPPPYSATQGAGNGAFPVKTPEAIAAEAKARTDALLAKQTTLANQTKQGFNTAYDRLNTTTQDNRTLQGLQLKRNLTPYSGQSQNAQDMVQRQWSMDDANAKQDLQTRLANVDLSLADYTNANEAERMKMETDMTNAERAYGMQVDQLALQRQGQSQNQFNADRSFNYGVGQDQIRNGQWGQTFNQNQSNSDRTFNAGRQDTSYNQGQDQLKNNAQYGGIYNPSGMTLDQVDQKMSQNSAAYPNASPQEQKRLHDENLYLASLKGSTYDQGTGEYSQGNNYVGTKTTAQQQLEFNQNLAVNELRFKQDSYKQKFDEDVRQFDLKTALDEAFRNDQLTMQQYNAASQRISANASATNANKPAAVKQPAQQKQPAADKVDPKVSADNYSFYMSQINGKAKGQAEAYIQSQSMNLSDQDYRDLLKYVREKL